MTPVPWSAAHGRTVVRAPRVEQRERRLHRVDVADRLTARELLRRRSSRRRSSAPCPPPRARPSFPRSPRAAVPVVQSGQWNWYRSIRSTPSRRRLCSHSSRIDSGRRSFSITPSGRPSQRRPHFVKTSTSSPTRYGASARPTTSSECPSPYTAAVSTQLTPSSTARRIAAIESSSSTSPQPKRHGPPIAQAPKPTVESSGPSSPSCARLHVRARPSSSR